MQINPNNRKVLFIHEGAITPTVKRLYLIDDLLSYGFAVELWSLRFLRTLWNDLPDEIDTDSYRKVASLADLKIMLAEYNVNETIILTSVADNFLNRHFYDFLHKNHFLYVFLNPYGNKMGKDELSIKDKLKLIFSSNVVKKIIPELKKVYHNKVFKPLHHIDFENHVLSSMKPRAEAINSNDYEAYLSLKQDSNRIIGDKYILFIDTYFPLHPDLPYFYNFNIKDVDKNKYLTSMNHFFDWLEHRYQMPVVIGLHPKSNYTDADFGGRGTYKYKTHSLVKDADIVLTHGSASTSLTVVFNKPALFVYPQYMLELTPKFVQKLKWFAESLGKKAINVDDFDESSIEVSEYGEGYRDNYMYTFMTTKENEHKSNKEIISSLFNTLFLKLENGEETPFKS